MISIDTLSYAKRLESAGVPSEQAEAHAMALSDILVTRAASKADVVSLEKNLILLMAQHKIEILKWIFASAVSQVSVMLVAMRYMPH